MNQDHARRQGVTRSAFVAAFALAGLAYATPVLAQDAARSADEIALGTRVLSREKAEQAYRRISRRYVYVKPAGRLARAGSVGARRIEGTVVALASGRRAIIEAGVQRYAVSLSFGTNPVRGETLSIMAMPANVPTFSYEASADTRESLPQFNDCTLSFDEFVRQVRRGAHFPEAPELGTRPNRAGLFQSGRSGRNKVDGLVAEREKMDAAAAKE